MIVLALINVAAVLVTCIAATKHVIDGNTGYAVFNAVLCSVNVACLLFNTSRNRYE